MRGLLVMFSIEQSPISDWMGLQVLGLVLGSHWESRFASIS